MKMFLTTVKIGYAKFEFALLKNLDFDHMETSFSLHEIILSRKILIHCHHSK